MPCSKRGPGSATTAVLATSTKRRRPSSTATGVRCPLISGPCATFQASGSTRRGRYSSSPSNGTRRSWTSTWRGCWREPWPEHRWRHVRRSPWRTCWCRPARHGNGTRRSWSSGRRVAQLERRRVPAARCRAAAPGSTPPRGRPTRPGRGSRQTPFEGSDRQGRGRLVDALRSGPVPARRGYGSCAAGPKTPDRARRVADGLVAEGLARRGPGGVLVLP